MSPKDTFSKVQAEWINATMPDYLRKLGKTKTHQLGQPEPKDDDDLTDWVTQKREDFFAKFRAELEASAITIPEWKKVRREHYAILANGA